MEKAKSIESKKRNSKKVEIKVYVKELINIIQEEGLEPKRNYSFGMKILKLVKTITPYRKLQRDILNQYWRDSFGEHFDIRKLENERQVELFR
ncbi:MAG TPA: hypothetical protein VHT73_12960 [Thermodesulfobacteriota bacterium]|nr:hypothetical protein [Thermodesulfobacteriota bacterium]